MNKRFIRLLDNLVAVAVKPSPLVLVSGFWRSGTTWLQWLLAESTRSRTVFEPLSPMNQEYHRLIRARLPTRDLPFHQAFFPYLDAAASGDAILSYLTRSFRGYGADEFTLILRSGWQESLRRGLVLKCVRCALSHTAIQREYSVRTVHIRRHPCAMIASLLAVDWSWGFEDVSVHDLIHGVRDGRESLFGGTASALRRCDRLGAVGRIAAYWALTERHVDRELAGKDWAEIVDYEDLVDAPAARLAELHDFLDVRQLHKPDHEKPMPYTRPGRRSLSGDERIHGWKQALSAKETETVCSIVADLFPEYPLHQTR